MQLFWHDKASTLNTLRYKIKAVRRGRNDNKTYTFAALDVNSCTSRYHSNRPSVLKLVLGPSCSKLCWGYQSFCEILHLAKKLWCFWNVRSTVKKYYFCKNRRDLRKSLCLWCFLSKVRGFLIFTKRLVKLTRVWTTGFWLVGMNWNILKEHIIDEKAYYMFFMFCVFQRAIYACPCLLSLFLSLCSVLGYMACC